MSSRRRPRVPRRPDQPEQAQRAEETASGQSEPSSRAAGHARSEGSARERGPRPSEGNLVPGGGTREDASARGSAAVRVNNPHKVSVEPPEHEGAGASLPQTGHEREEPTHPAAENGTGSAPEVAGHTGAGSNNVVDFTDRKKSVERDRQRARSGKRRSRATRWGLGILSLVVVAVLFCAVVFYSPLLATNTIKVEGAHMSDAQAISESLQPLQGKPLTRISQDEVKSLIGENIVIRDVSIEAQPPHQLVVTLHERIPVVTVKEGDQYVLVDKDGVAVGTAHSVDEAKVPLVEGGLAAVKQDSFHDVVSVVQTLPQSLLQQMKSAKADSDTNIQLEMKDGSTVRWGTSENSEYKAQVLAALVKAVGDQGQVSTYDVSSPDHPVTS